MLAIRYRSSLSIKKLSLLAVALIIVAVVLYVVSLYVSPAIAHTFFYKPISVSALPHPTDNDNRLIIPKLGINISYSSKTSALMGNAQWREVNLGNPEDGGTMILVAHKLSVQSTPQRTVAQSPFYALDVLAIDDKLIVDYKGVRYGYQVTSVHTGTVSDTSVPADSAEDHLVLYTYDSEEDTQRTVVIAKPLGKVAI